MKRTRTMCLLTLACCLLLAACQSRAQRHALPLTGYRFEHLTLEAHGGNQSVRCALVKPEFVSAVRENPLLGRNFVAEEFRVANRQVVVLSYGLWERRFGSDPMQIGESLVLDGRTYIVIGVMPKGFDAPEGAELWLPDVPSK